MPRKFDPLSLELDQAHALAQAEAKAARDAKAAQDALRETLAKTDWDEALRRIEEARESGGTDLFLNGLAIDRIPEAIAGLTGLQDLHLNHTQITDVSPLAELTGLKNLHLDATQITDVNPLAGLTGLQTLTLDNTRITDGSPFAGLTGLQLLFLGNTEIMDVSPLAGLTGLQGLYLDTTHITDVSPLAGLTGLQTLYLHNTQITDVSPLAGLTGLQLLNLSNTSVLDLRPLQNLPLLIDIVWDDVDVGILLTDAKALSDPAIAAAMAHEDFEDQRKALLAHLQSLPPWPEPLKPPPQPSGAPVPPHLTPPSPSSGQRRGWTCKTRLLSLIRSQKPRLKTCGTSFSFWRVKRTNMMTCVD